MQHWLVASAMGICLGLMLFACVRLRMYFGPIVRDRYGNTARQAYWIATILIMIVLANLGLRFLRIYLSGYESIGNSLMFEIWFAVLALTLALDLIFKRLYRNR
jgi:hypothetical protein